MERRAVGARAGISIYNIPLPLPKRKQITFFLSVAMFAFTFWLWLFASVGLSNAGLIPRNGDPIAISKNGSFAGVYSDDYGQDFFLGVPYALPPVGEGRFRVPMSSNGSWTGIKDAKAFSKECVGYGV
jgi:hypothetical protein